MSGITSLKGCPSPVLPIVATGLIAVAAIGGAAGLRLRTHRD